MEPRAAFPWWGRERSPRWRTPAGVFSASGFLRRSFCLIALSGYAGVDMRDACLAEGFDGYLASPGKFASWSDCSEATARTLARRSADPTPAALLAVIDFLQAGGSP